MPNYALVDVFGTEPGSSRNILIARAGSEIPAELDSLVSGGSKTATAPEAHVARTGSDAKLVTKTPSLGATTTGDETIAEAPFAATVTGISVIPEAGVTGADTNTRTLTIVNKGQAGSGTTVIGTLAFTNGVTATAFDEKAYTLTTTVANRNVAAGDVLVAVSTHAGTGIADPGGLVQVEITERAA